VAFHGGIHGDP